MLLYFDFKRSIMVELTLYLMVGWEKQYSSKIRCDLKLSQNYKVSSIVKTMEDVTNAKVKGERFNPSVVNASTGRKVTIQVSLLKAQIVADVIESGLSIKPAWLLRNAHLQEEQLLSVTVSAVYSLIHRLNPLIFQIGTKKQGSLDPRTPNSKARFAWCLQLGCCFDLYKIEDIRHILEDYCDYDKHLPIQKHYNHLHLTQLSTHQIAT